MIAAKEEEVLRVPDLVGKEEADGLETVFSSVNIVTQEEVICFWWIAAVLKESQEIGVLPMYVSCTLRPMNKIISS